MIFAAYILRRRGNYVNGTIKNLLAGNTEIAARMIQNERMHIFVEFSGGPYFDMCLKDLELGIEKKSGNYLTITFIKRMESPFYRSGNVKTGNSLFIMNLIEGAQKYGEISMLVNAAGVSTSQAPIEVILKVDLYGTAVLLEEVGKVIKEGGAGVTISIQSGWRMPALTAGEDELLATTPAEELPQLP